eukprot:COSAG05_NODE_437_length_9835_cov_3.761915_1_plen_92_part_10
MTSGEHMSFDITRSTENAANSQLGVDDDEWQKPASKEPPSGILPILAPPRSNTHGNTLVKCNEYSHQCGNCFPQHNALPPAIRSHCNSRKQS